MPPNYYTCKGRVIWDDPDDPVVGNVIVRDDGRFVLDNTLQQALSQIWRDHGNLAPVTVTITVQEGE
jgi:hypothetical protein